MDIIVGLGHSGYEKDMEIAQKVPHVDVVVGAHTHSFLYTETAKKKNPSVNIIRGPYPTLVDNVAGGKAIVVQAFAYTKYLGHVNLEFDELGKLVAWTGEPILLDNKFKQDQFILDELKPWKEEITNFGRVLLGFSKIVLRLSREKECQVGNFMTDSMVWAYRNKRAHDGSKIRLALANSGSIRASFDKGNITVEDMLITFPFQNTYDLINITGKHLRQAFEHSVVSMSEDGKNDAGRFLQVKGFKLKYDLTRTPGDRLLEALVLCQDCEKEEYRSPLVLIIHVHHCPEVGFERFFQSA